MAAAARRVKVLLLVFCLFVGGHSLHRSLRKQHDDEGSNSTSKCQITFPKSCERQACMVFLEEVPWVIIPEKEKRNKEIFEERKAFPCRRHKEYGIDGMLFEMLGDFWREKQGLSAGAEDYQCVFAGTDCTWNNMFNLVAADGISDVTPEGHGPFQLVFLDALLETDKRRRSSSNASVPLFNDRLVIVGSKGTKNVNYLRALKEPFDKYCWYMNLGAWVLMLAAGLLLKPSDPSRGRARYDQRDDWGTFLKKSFHSLSEAVAAMLSVEEYIADKTNDSEEDRLRIRKMSQKRLRSLMSVHYLIRVLYTMAVALFFVVFVILYEAAFTNFLFEERLPELQRPVRQLSEEDLSQYIVQSDSAVGDVFHVIQSKRNETESPEDKLWIDCLSYHECIRKLNEGRKHFTVMEEIIARWLIKDYGCDELTIFTSVDTLFEFNAVMYYSPSLDATVREDLDLYLLSLKLNQENERVEEKFLGNTECQGDNQGQITIEKIVVPFIAVLIAVLFALSVQFLLIFLLWCQERNATQEKDRLTKTSFRSTLSWIGEKFSQSKRNPGELRRPQTGPTTSGGDTNV